MTQTTNITENALLQVANNRLDMTRMVSAAKSQKVEQAAQDFESVFVSEMLKPMFETTEVDDLFGGGKGEEIFRGFLIQEMGKSIAKQGGLGLASHVRAELLKTQEKS